MTFRNPLLLAGVAAAVLPLVLHLVRRAHARGVEWGAMPLLTGPAGARALGPAVRSAAVLTLRAACVAVLAVTLARPAFEPDDAAAAGAASTAVVLVVDGSPSMLHPEADATRFELARRAALERLGRLSRGDQAGLIELGVTPSADVTLSPDLQAVASQLASMTTGTGAADQADGVRRARDMLSAAGVDGGEVDLIGDRQRSAWAALATAGGEGTDAPGDVPGAGPRVIATPVGSTQDQNVAVESVTPLDPPAIVGVPAAFRVRIRNDGPQPQGGLTLRLSSRRGAADEVRVAVAAFGRTEVVRTLTFDRPGPVVVAASVDDAGFPADNTARRALDVIDRPSVVVIDAAAARPGVPATNPAATRSSASAIDGRAFAVTTAAAPPSTLPAVVIVSARVDDAVVSDVERYVAGGGALLLSPASDATAAAWDRQFWKGGFGLSPAADDRAPAGGPAGERLVPHAGLSWRAAGRDDASNLIPDAAAEGVVGARPRFGLARSPGDTVLADAGGEPVVIERAFGSGRVVVVATPLDVSGSGVDASGGLVDALLRRLCVRAPDRNVAAGVPIEFTARLPRDRNAYVLRPDGRLDRVPVLAAGGEALVRYARTDAAGRYVVRVGEQTPLEWVVHNDPAESDLALLDDAALSNITKAAGVELRPGGTADPPRRATDTTALLTAALVVLLAAEAWLAGGGGGS